VAAGGGQYLRLHLAWRRGGWGALGLVRWGVFVGLGTNRWVYPHT